MEVGVADHSPESAGEVAGKHVLASASTFEVLVSHAKVLAMLLAATGQSTGIHHHSVACMYISL
jgi:hypothetical protein